jgi:hypothetical protein
MRNRVGVFVVRVGVIADGRSFTVSGEALPQVGDCPYDRIDISLCYGSEAVRSG